MASINKVIIVGRLGRDPERKGQGTNPLASLAVATTRSVKSNTGSKDETDWHRVSCFGPQAKYILENGKRGCEVYLEGSLRTRSYDDAGGVKQFITEIVVDQIQILNFAKNTNAQVVAQTPQAAAPATVVASLVKPEVTPAPETQSVASTPAINAVADHSAAAIAAASIPSVTETSTAQIKTPVIENIVTAAPEVVTVQPSTESISVPVAAVEAQTGDLFNQATAPAVEVAAPVVAKKTFTTDDYDIPF